YETDDKDLLEVKLTQSRAIRGVATTSRADDGVLSDKIRVLGHGDYNEIDVEIMSWSKDTPLIDIGCSIYEESFPSRINDDRVWLSIHIPESVFNAIWSDLSAGTDKTLQIGLNMDFRNLFFDFDPIGGCPRTAVMIHKPESDVHNFDEIPEELLPFIGPFGRREMGVDISVCQHQLSLTESTISIENYDGASLLAKQHPNGPVTFQSLYQTERQLRDLAQQKVSRLRFVLIVMVGIAIVGWLKALS
ncbi:hypothetical protein PQ077_01795, partial [Litorivicinus sp.]|nr:hypothetical protein [Litorivicinus sp.]